MMEQDRPTQSQILAKAIESKVEIPDDAIFLTRVSELKELLEFIENSILPGMKKASTLEEACKIIINNEEVVEAISGQYPLSIGYVKEYFSS